MIEGSCLEGNSVASLNPGEEGAVMNPSLSGYSLPYAELTVDIGKSFG